MVSCLHSHEGSQRRSGSAHRLLISARIMRELRTLDAQLTERWPGYPASRTFRDALAA